MEICIGSLKLEILRKIRWIFYLSVFALVFLIASYWTFPAYVLQDLVTSSITNAVVSMGPNLGMPKVSLDDISLWRFSGIRIDGLKIAWPKKKYDPSFLTMEFNSIKSRLGIFSMLAGAKTIVTDLQLYSGDFKAQVKVSKQNKLSYIYLSGAKIDLGKMTFIEQVLGIPVHGIISLNAELSSVTSLAQDGTGPIKLELSDLFAGPGAINLPTGGLVSSLTIPNINLGALKADFYLENKVLNSKALTISGGDLEADLEISVNLNPILHKSRIDGQGWFKIKSEFVNANETLKMLYELIPALRMAQANDGKVGFSIKGNLMRPQANFTLY
jgi:type II secretion system protein N